MSRLKGQRFRLTDRDLDFLIETVSAGVTDKLRLKQIILEDENFRNQFANEEKVFRRVMDDGEILLKISPHLFFEILLRKAMEELEQKGYTLEKTSHMKVPVFDAQEVAEILDTFRSLHGHFQQVKKPLNFISEYYLQYKRLNVFG